MAQRRNSRGGSSRSGGSRAAPSTNMAAYAFAVVAVVAVILVLVIMNSGKGETPEAAPDLTVSTAPPPIKPVGPVKPAEAPYPPVNDALISKARALVKTFVAPAAEGDRLYDEGMRAKNAKDDKTWQSKMEEAMGKYQEIKDGWNEMISMLPETKEHDQEDVANHYLGHEGQLVTKALTRLEAIRKTMRLH